MSTGMNYSTRSHLNTTSLSEAIATQIETSAGNCDGSFGTSYAEECHSCGQSEVGSSDSMGSCDLSKNYRLLTPPSCRCLTLAIDNFGTVNSCHLPKSHSPVVLTTRSASMCLYLLIMRCLACCWGKLSVVLALSLRFFGRSKVLSTKLKEVDSLCQTL